MSPSNVTLQNSVQTDLLTAALLVRGRNNHIWLDDRPIGRQPRTPNERQTVLQNLATALYSRWFSKAWSHVPENGKGTWVVDRVRAAHAATCVYEHGWVAHTVGPNGYIVATRTGQPVPFGPADYTNLTRATFTRAGDSLAVTSRRDTVDVHAGWWVTWRGQWRPSTSPLVRIYWNCGPDAVPVLVHDATALLERDGIAYSMKCPIDEALFGRVDSVVLYLAFGAWLQVKNGLSRIHAMLGDRLRDDVPPLTLKLGRGVAVAEDPGSDNTSFGQSRALAVSDGVLLAMETRTHSNAGILEIMQERLAAHGIPPERPYVRASSLTLPEEQWRWEAPAPNAEGV